MSFATRHDVDHHRRLVREDRVDEAELERLARGQAPSRIGEFAHHALRQQIAQARERADVGGHADVDLLDDEERVLGRVAAVADAGEIDAAADAAALYRHQNRNARAIEHVERLVELEHVLAEIGVARARAPVSRGPQVPLVDPAKTERSMPAVKCLPVEDTTITRAFAPVVDVAHDRGQLAPEFRHHGVELVAALQLQMRDVVFDLDVEAAIGHGKWSCMEWRARTLSPADRPGEPTLTIRRKWPRLCAHRLGDGA